MGQGLVESFGGLVAMRFLIGLFEAGFFPGCAYLISMYYKRYELQRRFTMFFSASIIAGAIGGLFSLFIQSIPFWSPKTRSVQLSNNISRWASRVRNCTHGWRTRLQGLEMVSKFDGRSLQDYLLN